MNKLNTITLTLIMLLLPLSGWAQFGWDMAGVEAFIDDHKTQRSLLISRSIIEQGNKVLHSTSDDTNGKYRDMGKELDKYTKAFDAIDIIVNSLSTGFQVYHTVDNVSDKVQKYKDLLEDFNNKIIARGKIELIDTMLISINRDAIRDVYDECQNIYGSLTSLVAYSSGTLLCKTSDINLQIQMIDRCLRRIDDIINRAYFQTYTYIKSRIYMWNRAIWTQKSKLTICNEAYSRWRTRGRETKVNPQNSNQNE